MSVHVSIHHAVKAMVGEGSFSRWVTVQDIDGNIMTIFLPTLSGATAVRDAINAAIKDTKK